MIGMSLAIGLAREGIKTVIIEKDNPTSQLLPDFDGRVSAISKGSIRVLESLGIMEKLEDSIQPILDIRVVDGYSHSFVHFKHEDADGEPMGYMIENRHLRIALLEQAEKQATLTLMSECEIINVERDGYKATLTLANGERLQAPLLIACDGRHSYLRSLVGIKTHTKHYSQTAIVCVIEHEIPHEGLAVQRFLPSGPFAALPMLNNRSCLVWSEDSELASHVIQLPEADFLLEIEKRLGTHLGKFKIVGKRFTYPLNMVLAKEFIAERFALVGDSAHGIHPIAGQGINIGFRDVAVMVELITEAMKLGQDIGGQALLQHYQRWRRFDALGTGFVMDSLTHLFSNAIPPVRTARRIALDTVNSIASLKKFFMKEAMGISGDLPKMMQKL